MNVGDCLIGVMGEGVDCFNWKYGVFECWYVIKGNFDYEEFEDRVGGYFLLGVLKS